MNAACQADREDTCVPESSKAQLNSSAACKLSVTSRGLSHPTVSQRHFCTVGPLTPAVCFDDALLDQSAVTALAYGPGPPKLKILRFRLSQSQAAQASWFPGGRGRLRLRPRGPRRTKRVGAVSQLGWPSSRSSSSASSTGGFVLGHRYDKRHTSTGRSSLGVLKGWCFIIMKLPSKELISEAAGRTAAEVTRLA